jgi:hypothetical protein
VSAGGELCQPFLTVELDGRDEGGRQYDSTVLDGDGQHIAFAQTELSANLCWQSDGAPTGQLSK